MGLLVPEDLEVVVVVVVHHLRVMEHRREVVVVEEVIPEVVAAAMAATQVEEVEEYRAVMEHHRQEGLHQAMEHPRTVDSVVVSVVVLVEVVDTLAVVVVGHLQATEHHRTEEVEDRLPLTGHHPLGVVTVVVVVAATQVAVVSVVADSPVEHPPPVTAHPHVVEAMVVVVDTPAVEAEVYHRAMEHLPSEVATEVVSVADPAVIPMVVEVAAVGPHRITVHPALEVAVLVVVRVTPATVVTNINHAMCSSREIRPSTSYHFHEFYKSNGYPGKLYTMTDKILTSHEAKGCEIGRRNLADIQSKSAKGGFQRFVFFSKCF